MEVSIPCLKKDCLTGSPFFGLHSFKPHISLFHCTSCTRFPVFVSARLLLKCWLWSGCYWCHMAVRKVIPVWSVKSNIGDANVLIEFIGCMGQSPSLPVPSCVCQCCRAQGGSDECISAVITKIVAVACFCFLLLRAGAGCPRTSYHWKRKTRNDAHNWISAVIS